VGHVRWCPQPPARPAARRRLLCGQPPIGGCRPGDYRDHVSQRVNDALLDAGARAQREGARGARHVPSAKGEYAAAGVLDLSTGATVTYNERVSFQTASIVKADILAALLWKLQNDGGHLSESQKTLATKMITQSDNTAASALYSQLGGAAGLSAANKAFGLTSTTPGPGSTWGKAHTTVTDQLTLLKVLSSHDSPLSEASRSYQLGLMSRVVSDQRWGVPAAAQNSATAVYVKNGWDTLVADGGLWEINTIGRIVEPGHDWLVVVLSSHNTTQDAGEDLVEGAAKLAVDGLRES
jgi:hypothetical protein